MAEMASIFKNGGHFEICVANGIFQKNDPSGAFFWIWKMFWLSVVLIVIQVVWKDTRHLHLSISLYSDFALYSDGEEVFLANHSNSREHVFLMAALCCTS